MNDIFRSYLRQFVLVVFNDTLVYSNSVEPYVKHLQTVLELLKAYTLYAKYNKCSFLGLKLEYCGHIISAQDVSTDQQKIKAVLEWPTPKNLKHLKGFLGLTGYYGRFIRDHGKLCRPLNELLKKNAFQWNDNTDQAFEFMKKVMI